MARIGSSRACRLDASSTYSLNVSIWTNRQILTTWTALPIASSQEQNMEPLSMELGWQLDVTFCAPAAAVALRICAYRLVRLRDVGDARMRRMLVAFLIGHVERFSAYAAVKPRHSGKGFLFPFSCSAWDELLERTYNPHKRSDKQVIVVCGGWRRNNKKCFANR